MLGWPWIAGISATLVAAGLLAALFPIEQIVRAPGTLRAPIPSATIRNAVEGQVVFADVFPGKPVRAGQVLWRIDDRALMVDARQTHQDLDGLEDDLADFFDFDRFWSGDERPAESGSSRTRAKIQAYRTNLESLRLEADQARLRWDRRLHLPPGFVAPVDLDELKQAYERAALAVESFRATTRDDSLTAQRHLQQEISDLRRHGADVERNIQSATVRAPVSGVLEEIRAVHSGDFLPSGMECLRIVPRSDEGMVLELRLDPRDRGKVGVGQWLRIQFPGLPPGRYATLSSRLTRIAAETTGLEGKNPVVLAEAVLSQPWLVDRWGDRLDLQPGMVADVRIQTGIQSVLSWALEKLELALF